MLKKVILTYFRFLFVILLKKNCKDKCNDFVAHINFQSPLDIIYTSKFLHNPLLTLKIFKYAPAKHKVTPTKMHPVLRRLRNLRPP